jgi:superfamily II DNA or RNA helicase
METSKLTKKGYSIKIKELSKKQLKEVKSDLTIRPFVPDSYGKPPDPFKVFVEKHEKMYMPRQYARTKFGKATINDLPPSEPIKVNFAGTLKPFQIDVANKCIEALKNEGGGIMVLTCGSGKTVILLYILAMMGVKILIIASKSFLLNQWRERIEQFIPDANVGIIQQDNIKIEGMDIVLGMLQSISMKQYPIGTFDSFDFVCFDEVHLVPSKVFSRAFHKLNARYMIGLSATPNRADGLTKILKWYLGEVIVNNTKNKKGDENIITRRYNINYTDDEEYNNIVMNFNGKPNTAKMISNIVECKKRNKLIAKITFEAIKEGLETNKIRKILILGGRVGQLEILKKMIEKKNICTVGLYIGKMKKDELKESESKDVILGTFPMADTGLDIAGLNMLMMISPKSNITQAIGRVENRNKNGPVQTHIIDIVDKFSSFYNQSLKRFNYYNKNKYTIVNYNVDNDNTIVIDEPSITNIRVKKENRDNNKITIFNDNEDSCSSESETETELK